jgi:hypothetical protein
MERSMTTTTTEDKKLHECHQRERLTRVDNLLFGNGSEGMVTKMARIEVKVSWVYRLTWFLATTWFLTLTAAVVHFMNNGVSK